MTSNQTSPSTLRAHRFPTRTTVPSSRVVAAGLVNSGVSPGSSPTSKNPALHDFRIFAGPAASSTSMLSSATTPPPQQVSLQQQFHYGSDACLPSMPVHRTVSTRNLYASAMNMGRISPGAVSTPGRSPALSVGSPVSLRPGASAGTSAGAFEGVLSPTDGVSVIVPQSRNMSQQEAILIAAQEAGEEANADRMHIKVEGFYEQDEIGGLIPSEMPRSRVLYVLTASDGRDMMFKTMQYTLLLIICLLKRPSLFSPSAVEFLDMWAQRFWNNYNTIRHGRSLFKVGRWILNLFQAQAALERLLMVYKKPLLRAQRSLVRVLVLPIARLIGFHLPRRFYLTEEEEEADRRRRELYQAAFGQTDTPISATGSATTLTNRSFSLVGPRADDGSPITSTENNAQAKRLLASQRRRRLGESGAAAAENGFLTDDDGEDDDETAEGGGDVGASSMLHTDRDQLFKSLHISHRGSAKRHHHVGGVGGAPVDIDELLNGGVYAHVAKVELTAHHHLPLSPTSSSGPHLGTPSGGGNGLMAFAEADVVRLADSAAARAAARSPQSSTPPSGSSFASYNGRTTSAGISFFVASNNGSGVAREVYVPPSTAGQRGHQQAVGEPSTETDVLTGDGKPTVVEAHGELLNSLNDILPNTQSGQWGVSYTTTSPAPELLQSTSPVAEARGQSPPPPGRSSAVGGSDIIDFTLSNQMRPSGTGTNSESSSLTPSPMPGMFSSAGPGGPAVAAESLTSEGAPMHHNETNNSFPNEEPQRQSTSLSQNAMVEGGDDASASSTAFFTLHQPSNIREDEDAPFTTGFRLAADGKGTSIQRRFSLTDGIMPFPAVDTNADADKADGALPPPGGYLEKTLGPMDRPRPRARGRGRSRHSTGSGSSSPREEDEDEADEGVVPTNGTNGNPTGKEEITKSNVPFTSSTSSTSDEDDQLFQRANISALSSSPPGGAAAALLQSSPEELHKKLENHPPATTTGPVNHTSVSTTSVPAPVARREKKRPAPILDQTVPMGMPPVPLPRVDGEGAPSGTVKDKDNNNNNNHNHHNAVLKSPNDASSTDGSESDLSEGDLSLLGGEVGNIPALGSAVTPVPIMRHGMKAVHSSDALASAVSTTSSSELRVGLPAATAHPSQCRKSPFQFRTALMLLFLVRSVAAAARRIMRDMTLVSSERFFNVKVVERHRFQIHNAINICWFIATTIDLVLSTTRLCQKGWFQYAAARQNVHCRCACKRYEDPADFICQNHGFVTRRKTDLFFPPLDMDYGAPVTSNIGFFEAADPAMMRPSCARCGCIYDVPVQRVYASENPANHNPSAEIARRGGPSSSSATPLPMARQQRSGSLVVPDGSADNDTETRVVQPRVSSKHRGTPISLGVVTTASAVVSAENSLTGMGSPNAASPVTRHFQRFEGLFSLKESASRAADRVGKSPPSGTTAQGATMSRHGSGVDLTTDDVEAAPVVRRVPRREEEDVGLLLVPWVMRRVFNYAWLVMVHENFTSTLLMQLRYMAEWYLAFQYTFGNFECHVRDAPLNKVIHLDGAIAGLVAALVVLTRVVQSAPR